MAESGPKKTVRDWVRRYPPLVSFVIAVLIMLVIMPSALNLPQANPSTVLEYAPIPPEDDEEPPPNEGSLSTLGLGTSDTIEEGAGVDTGPLQLGEGDKPIVKRCVGTPARQTEDFNAPPCVPYFTGDNGGTTFRGVTKDEIKVVIYTDVHEGIGGDSGYETTPPAGEICDIDSAPNNPDNVGCINGEGTADHDTIQVTRALARYFNDRFQTYDRHVHFYVYWGSGNGPSGRRSDVADIFERIGPFASIDATVFGESQSFIEAAVKRQISIYSSYSNLPNRTFRENAPFLWSFWPDIEHQAALFKDYFCKRVAPFKVNFTGNADQFGDERKYGLLYTTDPLYAGDRQFAELAKKSLREGCPNGAEIDIAGEYSYPNNGFSLDTNPETIAKGDENIARMRNDGVTTIVWLSGYETEHSKSADEARWYPEWVIAGNIINDQGEEGSPAEPERVPLRTRHEQPPRRGQGDGSAVPPSVPRRRSVRHR